MHHDQDYVSTTERCRRRRRPERQKDKEGDSKEGKEEVRGEREG